jgi:peptide subunit release factor 1 (eRF1)
MSSSSDQALLAQLATSKGSASGCISLLLGAGSDLGSAQRLVTKELGAATHIKDRANRKQVLQALKAVQETLSGYRCLPDHGAAIYSGQCV